MVSLLDLAIIAAAREEYDRQLQLAAPELRAMQLTDFSDDILHHIFAYVSTMQDLRSFAYANKRAHRWVFRSPSTDALFGALYRHEFGQANALPDGRKSWKRLFNLRQSLAQDMNVTNPFQLNTLGILPPDRETEAVGYDHPIHFRTGQCLGYFGLEKIFPKGDGPLAVWGDYDGIFLVPSLDDILPSDPCTGRRATKQFSRIPGDSQVLTVLASPMSYNEETNSSTLFLGFASGTVQAVRVVDEDGRYTYDTVSYVMAHRDEVTTLTVLPVDPPCVASSSVDGSVIVYPESMSSIPSLENAFMGCRSSGKILCMAATKWGEDKQLLLCTGDERGRLALWSQQHMPGQSRNRPLSWDEMSTRMIEDGGSLPTVIRFLHQESDILTVGTNSGGLFMFRAHLSRTLQPAVVLERIAQVPRAHAGAVDSIKIVGNVLLTSGGYEGHVIGWDSQTLIPIGSIAVHPGRLYPSIHLGRPQVLLKCAVIGTVVWPEREVLVNLCRDGTVQVHSFAGASGLENEACFASGAVDGDATIAPVDSKNGIDKLTSDAVKAMISRKVTNQEPLPISSFQRVMYDADDALRGRMEMRIIQAGVQNRNNPLHPFMGADNVKYENTKMAFDLFSGLLPCMSCIDNDIGAFECRVRNGHDNDKDEPHIAVLFKRLSNTKNAWITEGEDVWTCGSPCYVDNKMTKKRCFMCQRWKGGVHPISKPRAKETHAAFYAAMGTSADAETSDVADLPAAKLGLSVESTSMQHLNVDSNSEEAQQLWIQMRTIQRALESQDPKLKKSHLDSDGNVGIEVSESFDTHSGLSPCETCRSVDKGAYECRMRHRHMDDLDKSHLSILFQRLSKSRRSWVRDDEPTWLCKSCKVKNRLSKKRCFVCQGWAGGRHPFERLVGDSDSQPGETTIDAIEVGSSDGAGHERGAGLVVVNSLESSFEVPEQPLGCANGATYVSTKMVGLSNALMKGALEGSAAENQRSSSPDSPREKSCPPDYGGGGLLPQESQPRSLDTLRQLMSESSDATMKGRMQMSIIQSACQHKKEPGASFRGADGNLYPDIVVAFETFSGVSACNECRASEQGAFTCRLTLEHLDDLDEALSSVVFRRMRDNKRAWILPGEPFWNCPQCRVDVKMSKKRCFLCQRWKDGKRIDEHSEGTSAGTETLKNTASSLASVTVTKGSSPNTLKVWECYVCFHLNHWKKYSCGGCGRRAGGRTIDMPLAQAEDSSEAANVSSLNPKVGPSVAASFPAGQCSIRKRKKSSTAKLWECEHCSYQNNMRNPKCARCGNAGEGGKVVKVKLNHPLILDVKEPAALAQAEDTSEAADVSALNPKPGASVAESSPAGHSPNRKRKKSSTAKLWECVHCSYQNNMRNPKCARCGKAGEGGKVVKVKLKHSLILDVKEPAAPPAGPYQWICPKCTYTNHVSFFSCSMCATLQSGKRGYKL